MANKNPYRPLVILASSVLLFIGFWLVMLMATATVDEATDDQR